MNMFKFVRNHLVNEDDLIKKLKRIPYKDMHRLISQLPINHPRVTIQILLVDGTTYNITQQELNLLDICGWDVVDFVTHKVNSNTQ